MPGAAMLRGPVALSSIDGTGSSASQLTGRNSGSPSASRS